MNSDAEDKEEGNEKELGDEWNVDAGLEEKKNCNYNYGECNGKDNVSNSNHQL